MTIKREYSILPQGEKDDFHHHVRDGRRGVTSQYLCLFTVITVVIILIFAGVATLTASMFYSDQISASYRHFWYSYESITANDTTNRSTSDDSSFTEGSRDETTSGPQRNSTDYADQNNKTFDTFRHHHLHNHHGIHHNSSDGPFDNYSTGESDSHGFTNTTGRNGTEESDMDSEIVNMEELKEKFAETMRDLEKDMEDLTGIRKAEFVVPIFMLTCFLTLFSVISLCCCVMMKRRDNRRRKLFGKLITDLQTGDSKTVLLNQSDLDD